MAAEIQQFSDEQLAQQSQAGDWASFDELVRRYETRIYRFTLSCCGNEVDARELTQETFVSAYQHLQKFDTALSLATWLFTIARRKCIDRSRRPRRYYVTEIPDLPDTDDPTVLIGRREVAADLWSAARRVLPDVQFQALWLHYVEDLSVSEVARVMRRLQPHVKVLLFRARRSLAKELDRAAAGEPILLRRRSSAPGPVAMSAVSAAASNANHL